ncbi:MULTISPECIES: LTA synthase family protein [Vagococcus]|uniref:Phosphoglycerol transferase I n=1 Tax=Vagococcus fluvialis bH819 TaxID=1255619 RepID=A0A1X6WK99_9ENTE|nr:MULTISPECIES: LTA synthase family protein [Vagococcus]SLM84688.1 Phosphoglycerol transferase I [Vagococcus fluvialis bH819]HCM89848.1 sulfatase [Vagococcus sp.]
MRFLTFLIVGLVISGLDILMFKETKIKRKVLNSIGYTVGINILTLFTMRYILGKMYVLSPVNYKTIFVLKYVLFAIVIGLLILFIKGLILNKIVITKNKEKTTLKSKILTGISVLFVFVGSFLYIGTVWFIDFFGKLTPEQFLFNFNSPVTGTASNVMDQAINGPVLLLVSVLVGYIFLMLTKFKITFGNEKSFSDKYVKVVGWTASIGVLIFGVSYSIKELQLVAVYSAYFDDSSYIKDNYHSPKNTKLTFPDEKKNLVHIYLESYENTYFDKNSGGYMDKNLMPAYEKLYKEGVSFSESDKKGGPYQTYGSSWSVASMVNMSMGLPLKIPMNGNSYGKSGYFLPGAIGIGDVLNKEGYNQTIMFGADADFGGLTSFFNNHKDFNIYDVKHARKIGKIPNDYNVWWGYEDKKLYDYAQEEITRLASEGKPFNFTMENADTHFPDGYIEKETPRPFDQQYANVIFHSQQQVVDFVKWIQEQPYYDDTVIVLTGDHLSMDKKFFVGFDKKYHRTTTNLIINGDFENKDIKTNNRQFAPFDMYPTILSSMGVGIKGDRLGLGTDLSSKEKTLIERDSLEKVNEELSKNSKFYNTEFVSEKKNSDY